MKKITEVKFRISVKEKESLSAYAEEHHTTVSELLRNFIKGLDNGK